VDENIPFCSCPKGECYATDKTRQGALIAESGKFVGMWIDGGVHKAQCYNFTEFAEGRVNVISIKPAA